MGNVKTGGPSPNRSSTFADESNANTSSRFETVGVASGVGVGDEGVEVLMGEETAGEPKISWVRKKDVG